MLIAGRIFCRARFIKAILTFPIYVHIHIFRMIAAHKNETTMPNMPCACANLRRAARSITRLYNHELRAEKIEITQFTLLMALDHTGDISQGKLGKVLALDSTTLTRMLEPLKKQGWIQGHEGDDRRVRIIRLTTAGRAKLQHGLPHWKRAQARIESTLGEPSMRKLEMLLTRVTAASEEQ